MSAETEVAERPNVTVLDTLQPEEPKAPETAETKEPPTEEAPEAPEIVEETQEHDEAGRFKPKNATQARFDELTRQRHEAQREATYWRGVAESQRPAKETATAPAPQGKPTADQFEDHGDYVEALTDWKVEQKLGERDASQKAATVATTWQQRAEAAKADLPDFDTVLAASEAPMSRAMAAAIQESDLGPQVAYHLAQNPALAEKLAGMSELGAAREIGKLEAILSAPKKPETADPAPKKVTTAPTPPTVIGAGRSTTGDPSKMSMNDYIAWRNAQGKQK